MELRIYLRVLLRKWWILLPAFLVTFTATIVLTFTQEPTYESTATFVVKPSASVGNLANFASVLDMLSRRTEIATTYAEVAASRLIKRQAIEELGLSKSQKQGLSVSTQLLAGTNVIEITVLGRDPVIARDFADMVGAQTMVYVRELYETYDLQPLDGAVLPFSPLKPNKALNLTLGAVLGLTLGAGLALVSEYLQAPLESVTNYSILDDETGVYNGCYFKQRLGEEMTRSKRNLYSLSLALMNVDQLEVMRTSFSPRARSEALRKVAMFLKQAVREEDIVARLDGTIFAFLLPDMAGEEAKAVLGELQERIAWTPFEIETMGVKLSLSSSAGLVNYLRNGAGQDEMLAQADLALQQAEAAGHHKLCLLSKESTLSKDGEQTDTGGDAKR